jgi:hypothetical protein
LLQNVNDKVNHLNLNIFSTSSSFIKKSYMYLSAALWILVFLPITLPILNLTLKILQYNSTQGVLAFKFPISILTRTQDFATRPLNLRKPSKFSKIYIFFFWMQILIKGACFQCTYCPSSIFFLQKLFFFDLKLAIELGVIIEWWPVGKIWD